MSIYSDTTVITGLLQSLSTADVLKVIDLGLSHKNAVMRGTKDTYLTILNANPFNFVSVYKLSILTVITYFFLISVLGAVFFHHFLQNV